MNDYPGIDIGASSERHMVFWIQALLRRGGEKLAAVITDNCNFCLLGL